MSQSYQTQRFQSVQRRMEVGGKVKPEDILKSKSTDPFSRELTLGKKTHLYRIILRTEDDGVWIGFSRKRRLKGVEDFDEEMAIYRKMKFEPVIARKRFRRMKGEFRIRLMNESEVKELQEEDKARGIVWSAYKDEKTEEGIETGMEKAWRVVTEHIPEGHRKEVSELTIVISRLESCRTELLRIKKGTIVTERNKGKAITVLTDLRNYLERKTEDLKVLARDKVDRTMKILEKDFTKGERLAFCIQKIPSCLTGIIGVLEKRREKAVPNISLFQLGRMDTLATIMEMERRRDIRLFYEVQRPINTLKFIIEDIESRERRKEMLNSYIRTLNLIKSTGTIVQQQVALTDLLEDFETFLKRFKTTVIGLRPVYGYIHGAIDCLKKAQKAEVFRNSNKAIEKLNGAIRCFDERIQNVKVKTLKLEKPHDSLPENMNLLAERIMEIRGVRRREAAEKITCASSEVSKEEKKNLRKGIEILRESQELLIRPWKKH